MKSDLLKKNTTSNAFEKLDISNTESCFIKLLLLCFHCNNNNNIHCSRTSDLFPILFKYHVYKINK